MHDGRFGLGRIRRWITVNLPRLPGRFSLVRCHPLYDCVVRLAYAAIRTAIDTDYSLAGWRFSREYIACGFECPHDLNAKVAQDRCTSFTRMMVKKDVVAVSP